jgi:hypothetical protein
LWFSIKYYSLPTSFTEAGPIIEQIPSEARKVPIVADSKSRYRFSKNDDRRAIGLKMGSKRGFCGVVAHFARSLLTHSTKAGVDQKHLGASVEDPLKDL